MWADVTDEITADDLVATNTTYRDFSDVTITSTAVYAGNSAKSSAGGIQLRSKSSNSGIVSTVSGGKVKSVTITVESGSNTIDVYGNNKAYAAASDLYSGTAATKGTKVGSLTATGTVSFSGKNFDYVGIRSNSGAIYITSIEIEWETVDATFASGKTMISFSNAKALNLTTASLPSGIAAYKMTAADASSVTLTAINSNVEANTGVILTGTQGTTYKIPVTATSGTDISATNLLVASDGTSNVTNAYVLSGGKFHPVAAGGIVIPAGKAYLPAGSISSAHELDIIFDEETTGIKAVDDAPQFLDGTFYDLQGRKVAQPTKGMYIVNGKKVIIK